MAVNVERYKQLLAELQEKGVELVAVSKLKSVEDIQALYDLGQRDFAENYVQELEEKEAALPADIRWHFIGHLQRNKVKYIIRFVHLIQGVDSLKLLEEINKQAARCDRVVHCLLQVHIAQEETKFGMDEAEIFAAMRMAPELTHVQIDGLMGMASLTDDMDKVSAEFASLQELVKRFPVSGERTPILSMGMSSDYQVAIKEGSTMVRIGSLLFGARG